MKEKLETVLQNQMLQRNKNTLIRDNTISRNDTIEALYNVSLKKVMSYPCMSLAKKRWWQKEMRN